jgi:transposase-like protein
MPRNHTNSIALRPKQLQAIDALLLGKTITASAEETGVDQSTLHRWLREDYRFQAALNQRIRDLSESR